MVEQNQKESLYDVLRLFQDLGLTKYVVLIGSWAEYFYDEFFSHEYYPDIATKDIDFLYRNLRLPDHKIPLIQALKEHGFIYDENPLTKVAKFHKKNIIEIEFLTRVIGQDQMHYEIESLGITAEGIRELSLINKYYVKVQRDGFSVFVPEPAAYVIHKILINEKRNKNGKAEKDMRSIKNILVQIMNHPAQKSIFFQIVNNLTKKEKAVLLRVCSNNKIDLDFISVDKP